MHSRKSNRFIRPLRFATALARVFVLCAPVFFGGCAFGEQKQYFEVVRENPDTGVLETNYYRMTVSGAGLWGVNYKFKAAYLNSITVDVLEGKTPFIPEADLPRAADDAFKTVMQNYYQAIQDRSTAKAKSLSGASDHDFEKGVLQLARMVFFTSLSNGDVASMGQTGDPNPYVFRKLVFYATAKNIDLEKAFGPQIDSIVGKVTALAQHEQERADQKQNMFERADAMLGNLPDTPATANFRLLLGLLKKPTASQPASPTKGS